MIHVFVHDAEDFCTSLYINLAVWNKLEIVVKVEWIVPLSEHIPDKEDAAFLVYYLQPAITWSVGEF